VRNDFTIAKNEHDGLKSRISDSQDEHAKWTLEERLIKEEYEGNEKKIKELKDNIDK
jgi:hypothetical protein